jgi:glycolate oxidase
VPSAIDRLVAELGADRVRTDPETLQRRADDLTEIPGRVPDAVVSASRVEEIIQVVTACAAAGLPLVPVVRNTNVGGLAIPERGGVVLDVSPMNRILEINEPEMYALLEPGVTWAQLKERLERSHPELAFAYALAPPDSSVVCNCLMDGLTTLSLRHGSTSMWINGVEAVLADGTLVRTGSAALVSHWCSNAPMPDLTGLFINMHGTTGIVTKMAVRLFPKKKFRRRYVGMAPSLRPALEWVAKIARDEICDDIGLLSPAVVKMALGAERPLAPAPGDPALVMIVDFSSNYVAEIEARDQAIRAAEFDWIEADRIGPLLPGLAPLLDLPARLGFLLDHPGGGLTWIGTYGPMSRWADGIERGSALMVRHGFAPAVVLRPMLGGHYGVLRLLARFDKRDADEVARVRRLNEELVDLVVDLGFVPYKTPAWVVDRLRSRIHPGFLSTLNAVRAALDPSGILNPGKWR